MFAMLPYFANLWPGWVTSSAALVTYLWGGSVQWIAIGMLVAIGLILTPADVQGSYAGLAHPAMINRSSTTRTYCWSAPHHQQITFTLPEETYGRMWQIVIDTADPLLAHPRRRPPAAGSRLRVPARTMLVLCRRF